MMMMMMILASCKRVPANSPESCRLIDTVKVWVVRRSAVITPVIQSRVFP